ncbi:RNA polymerase sigma factor sigB [Silene latifolia]|uniref:RNA polymerase sigma factor sigB n=1 Tax=Silene latifolia TaxID=37657 RepID=UPI003D78361A
MTCLLPHFKCQPSSILHPTSLLRSRETVCFRTHCAVSISPPPLTATETAKSDIEKLRLAYVQSNSSALPIYGSLTYINPLGSPAEDKFDSTLTTETLIENEEATVAAAASKALALARAAAKLAKDAALMAGSGTSQPVLSEGQPLQLKDSQQSENEQLGNMRNFENPDSDLREGGLTQCSNFEPDDLEPSPEELLLLEAELAESVAVRSTRQVERKAKRARAAEKGVSSGIPLKVGSSSRKKRTSVQEVDYNDPLRYLRGTTSTSKLLSASEEIKLSAGIQELLKLERLYDELKEKCGREPSFVQWAAAAGVDQRTLRTRVHQGTMCKDKMIKSNIRLVISIAKNYQGAGMNLQDLVQEGCRGLIRGAEKFDASKGFKFSTYAHWWIKQAVRKSLSDQSRTIRLPFHMVEATYRVKEAKKKLISEKGRHPNDEEVAEETGLSMKRVNAVLMTPKAPRSLDQKIGMDMNLKPSEIISDPEAETSEDLLVKQFMRQDLEKVIDGLSKREGQVIRWRFGLEDGRMKTLQEIGELMGVSRERIRQIESSAFRKLQNKKRNQHLEQYLYS